MTPERLDREHFEVLGLEEPGYNKNSCKFMHLKKQMGIIKLGKRKKIRRAMLYAVFQSCMEEF